MEQNGKIEKIDKTQYPLRQRGGNCIGLVPMGFLWVAGGICAGIAVRNFLVKGTSDAGALAGGIALCVLAAAAFIGGAVILAKVIQCLKILFAANPDHIMIWQNDRYLKFRIDEVSNYLLHFWYVRSDGETTPHFSDSGKIELIVNHNSYVAGSHDLEQAHNFLRRYTGLEGREVRRKEWRFKD
ncbi:MAG: hypothetical protein LBL66_08075 [Clostridiales bacterium]|jgi:hypothetical protein|nr:hypothetical protein [Clostridiales bacterium]